MTIRLRKVELSDLPVFFEDQNNSAANAMAAMKPQDYVAFSARWQRILQSTDTIVRTIEYNATVAGSICCFWMDGEFCLGYWVSQAFWGRGIATEAVRLMKLEVPQRPIVAYASSTNLGSIQVLHKNGFITTGQREAPETDRYLACTEISFRLDA